MLHTHTFHVSSGEPGAVNEKKTFDIKVPCFVIDLPSSQHYLRKCISSPIRNSSALILSPFRCFFFLFTYHSDHSVVSTTDRHLHILWHLGYGGPSPYCGSPSAHLLLKY